MQGWLIKSYIYIFHDLTTAEVDIKWVIPQSCSGWSRGTQGDPWCLMGKVLIPKLFPIGWDILGYYWDTTPKISTDLNILQFQPHFEWGRVPWAWGFQSLRHGDENVWDFTSKNREATGRMWGTSEATGFTVSPRRKLWRTLPPEERPSLFPHFRKAQLCDTLGGSCAWRNWHLWSGRPNSFLTRSDTRVQFAFRYLQVIQHSSMIPNIWLENIPVSISPCGGFLSYGVMGKAHFSSIFPSGFSVNHPAPGLRLGTSSGKEGAVRSLQGWVFLWRPYSDL